MPLKQPEDSLLFLFRCLEASDYKTIDFHAVGAAAGLKAPAARMRFTRLKKLIETSASDSTTSSAPGTGTIEPKSKAGPKKTTKPTNTVKCNLSAGSKDGSNQTNKSVAVSQIKAESVEPEIEVPPAPIKRQSRGKKIDVLTAFESDSSPTPGPRIVRDDGSSDYEYGQDTTKGNGAFAGGVDSEDERPAKRRRTAITK